MADVFLEQDEAIPVFVTDSDATLGLIENVCLFLSIVALVISTRLLLQHLRHFSQPIIQRKIIVILWMVPLYSITSWLSLKFVHASMYLDMIRDCYESFVIYMFFALCYCYIGQIDREHIEPTRIYAVLTAKRSVHHLFNFPSWTGVRNEIDLTADPRAFLMQCKRNILQFVLIKPMSAILVIVLSDYFHKYETGNFALTNGYIYVTTIVNCSITLSMYWLVMFYQATRESLIPFDPVPKFVCIKGVLFFSYWQSVIVAVLVKLGIITEIPVIHYSVEHVSAAIQNGLICIEMVGFAFLHAHAFSAEPFYFLPSRRNSETNVTVHRRSIVTSARAMLLNAVDFSDVVDDIQEVAPEIPLVKYLRRNSSNAVAPPVPATSSSQQVAIPNAAGLEIIRQTKRSQVPLPNTS